MSTADASADAPVVATPTGESDRLVTFDVLRGVAVLGILLMNIPGFALEHIPYGDPRQIGDDTLANSIVWWTLGIGFEGTMRFIFSLLFGAGALLLIERLEKKGAPAADIWTRRILWLLALGVLHAYVMLWPGDILYTYAVCGLFIFPFRTMRPTRLVVAAVVVLSVMAVRGGVEWSEGTTLEREAALVARVEADGGTLTKAQQETKTKFEKRDGERREGRFKGKEAEIYRAGYPTTMAALAPVNAERHTTELYEWGIWDGIGVMFLGMALHKWGFLAGRRRTRDVVLLTVAGYGVGLPLGAVEQWLQWRADFAMSGMLESVTYDVPRVAVGLGHVGTVLLVCGAAASRPRLARMLAPLAATGRMALTNYLGQTVICVLLFYGVGFGLYGRFEWWQLYGFVGAIWAFQLVTSPLWLRYFRFGPAEWLWRSLTYWRPQRMRRARRVGVTAVASAP